MYVQKSRTCLLFFFNLTLIFFKKYQEIYKKAGLRIEHNPAFLKISYSENIISELLQQFS